MDGLSRRQFLKASLALGAASIASPVESADDPREKGAGPSDRVRIAIAGVRWTQYVPDHRGRGSEHVAGFVGMPDVEIAALCDVDERVIGDSMKLVEEKTGKRPRYCRDFRQLRFDAASESIPDDVEANALLRREYRRPFVVPDVV